MGIYPGLGLPDVLSSLLPIPGSTVLSGRLLSDITIDLVNIQHGCHVTSNISMVNTGSGTIQNAMFKGAILKLKKICFKNISKIKSEIQIQTATYKLYIHE